MNKETDSQFVYITPLLSEIERIKSKSCDRKFCEPHNFSKRKIDDFNDLLMAGENVAATHVTFSNATEETPKYIANGNYILILDEVLDILVDFNDITKDSITKNDIQLLINEKFISVDCYGKVTWNKQSYPNSKYANVERLARNEVLFFLDESLLVWQFPPEIFRSFRKVYVLTYLFQGSLLKPYFEYHGIEYGLASVEKDSNEQYKLCEFKNDINQRKEIGNLIHIYENSKLNDYKNFSLSKRWFQKAKADKLKKLKNDMYDFIHNKMKAKSSQVLWTCPKLYHDSLKGSGYTIVRRMTQEEKKLPKPERDSVEKKLKCFLPCNTRATNDYMGRDTLMYVLNLFPNPFVVRYFEAKNIADKTNIEINQDYFSLSAMLQWIWRSAIRDGKPINVYIPSTRMRNLLIMWINGEM